MNHANKLITLAKLEYKLATRHFMIRLLPLIFFIQFIFIFGLIFSKILPNNPIILATAIWLGALLAILLACDKLFSEDDRDGVLEQIFIADYAKEIVFFMKVFLPCLFFIIPLIVIIAATSVLFANTI